MSGLDPNEVARLLALPESHPERLAAMRDPEFAMLACALPVFERGGHEAPDAGTLAGLRARLAGHAAEPVRARPAPARRAAGPALTPWRAGLAFAALAVVAGLAWWALPRRTQPEIVRGVEDASAFRILESRTAGGHLILSWPAVPHASHYRVRFLGPDLGEITHLDAGPSTRIVLRRDALPPGLVSGAHMAAEVAAMRGGTVLATTPAAPLRLP